MNNPYAEAYLQMNPAVARSYYIEHNGQSRSNYNLTSEHQKIICVLIMIALGCYIIGFAIIMIRQVIKDTEQRAEIDGCDCIKFNGEHCFESNCLESTLPEEFLGDVNLPDLSSRAKEHHCQEPIEVSVNIDGTFCREQSYDKINNNFNLIKSTDELENLSTSLPNSCNLNTNIISNIPSSLSRNSFKDISYRSINNISSNSILQSNSNLKLNNSSILSNKPIVSNSSIFINFQSSSLKLTDSSTSLSKSDRTLNNITNSLTIKEKINFKQTEIQLNLEGTRLLKKVKSLMFDYPTKQKNIKSIEHL